MKTALTRRRFLRRTALGAATLSATRFLPQLLAVPAGSDQLKCVQIGCGGRGLSSHLDWLVKQSKDTIMAIVDPDEKRQAEVKRFLQRNQVEADKVQVFEDYRVMFDKVGKQADAFFIATPNHHHAPAAKLALELGKPVYCEKPLCRDIGEARALLAMAKDAKVPTQMGNQGHCEEGYRRLCEFIQTGVIGQVTETHSYTNRANGTLGASRPPTEPVPAGLHWDEWIGPAPFRDYHAGLHPHDWHSYYDFGNGSLGNMGCHVLDGVFWALQVEHPAAIEAEEIRGGSAESFPVSSRLRFDLPARAGRPAFKAYWYEGLTATADPSMIGKGQSVKKEAQNWPPLLLELQKKYPDEEFDPSGGTLYVGEKGIIYTRTYGERMHVLPLERMSEFVNVPKTLPRTKNIMTDFLDACRAGKKETAAGFEYGARLTEFTLLGNLAQHAGVGRKIEWDGPGMKVTNLPDLNQWLHRPARQGWPSC